MDVDVVIPARNEERTIRGVIGPLVRAGHRVLVVDSASDDGTAVVAAAAGARVVRCEEAGKGRALRRSVEETTAECVVFCDADVSSFDAAWVDLLVAPLAAPDVHLVKPVYRRPLRLPDGGVAGSEGGRVTELLARPLLSALAPELAWLAQPLAGEYAARRESLLDCEFPDGYGVEIALLLEVSDHYGPRAVTEVDLQADRWHRNRPLRELSSTADDVLRTALTVLEHQGRIKLADGLGIELSRPRPRHLPGS